MENLANAWQRDNESGRDFDTAEIARGQNKYSGIAAPEGCDLQRSIPEPLILRQDDPALLADHSEPGSVLLITSEVVIVDFDHQLSLDELSSNWIYSE
jgi:hypothetical protein